MKKTVIISGHPDLNNSTANRQIMESLTTMQGLAIYDLQTLYPDGRVNVLEEQDRLRTASLVILQFPFIWYGMPSHMRRWMELVFAPGFAYGKGGMALQNKHIMLSVTLGGSMESYSSSGLHQHPVQTFLRPIEMFTNYCGMNYLPPVYSYSMERSNNEDVAGLSKRIQRHVQRLEQVIHALNE
jgi:putative NADPH-quinone reductase